MSINLSIEELTLLRALAARFPTADEAIDELAALSAKLSLPKTTAHVMSDVHGEYKKLRHIINNASGHLRPLVASLFEGKLGEGELRELLAVLYYPHELIDLRRAELSDPAMRREWVGRVLRQQFTIIRSLARSHRREDVFALFPKARRELFEELLDEPSSSRNGFVNAMLDGLAARDRDFAAVRVASHLVRNLSVDEIIVAGDLGDRGPRVDRVIDYLKQQPRVSIAWGNHDLNWMGACLGQEALIATVLRISLRYRRLSQLEEGYGVIMAPLEKLAREVYGDDPVEHFMTKGTGLREDVLMARMQKAIAIMQFKLEGQTIDRHPEWKMEARNLLGRVNTKAGTIEIEGKHHPLRDSRFPTLDPASPNALSPEEATCMKRLRESFLSSARLWDHMSYLVRQGAMWLRRDRAVIFHGCVPVDESGKSLTIEIGGKQYGGRPLLDAFDSVVRRAFRRRPSDQNDADWLWYLWTGPVSPLFGKDRMATFESYFVADKEAKKEHKNAYFKLLHDAEFCRRIAAEFGVHDDALIVNGHVPVRVDKGEEPVKRGGNAVTIDGAFSEAYGDRGYTLVLAPERVELAEHHHFESISEAITTGADIVPKLTTIRSYDPPRRIGDTEQGETIRGQINALERLVEAYEEGTLAEAGG